MYGHRLLRELIGLLFLFCGLLMLLSLWSYSAGDPSFNHAVTLHDKADIQNAAGLFGAYLAGSLVEAFGLASILWVVFFLAVGAALLTHWVVLKWYRWIGYLLLFLCMVAFSQSLNIGLGDVRGGGFAGKCLMLFCSGYLSSGSLILWFFLFIIALELSFETSFLGLAAAIIVWVWRRMFSQEASSQSEDESGAGKTPLLQSIWQHLKDIREHARQAQNDRRKLDIMIHDQEKESGSDELTESLQLYDDRDPDPSDVCNDSPAVGDPASGNVSLNVPSGDPQKEKPAEELPSFIFEEVDASSAAADDLQQTAASGTVSVLPETVQEKHEGTDGNARGTIPKPAEQTPPQKPEPKPADIGMANAGQSVPSGSIFLPQQIADPAEVAGGGQMFPEPQSSNADDANKGSVRPPADADKRKEAPEHPLPIPADDVQEMASSDAPPRQKTGVDELLERVVNETMGLQSMPPEQQEQKTQEFQQEPKIQELQEQEPQEKPAFVMPKRRQYAMPPNDLLKMPPASEVLDGADRERLMLQGEAVITCLKNFHVDAELAKITTGPVVTMFELRPAPGVKATRITNLANDLAMSLKAESVRMQAPVPGTDTVGVEVPNEKRQMVFFREIIENESFRNAKSLLTVALGKDTSGHPVSADIAKMPHLLVAGATGKGKSVCLNAMLLSLLLRARPDEVQLILIDPKRVEFSMYAKLPHLVHPVITDMEIAKNALLWALEEMERRLKLFASIGRIRNITEYNEYLSGLFAEAERTGYLPENPVSDNPEDFEKLPFIIIVIDELADLMLTRRKEVEGPIIRLVSLARAAGIHLIIATQRPSVDVITGIIKANFPCRIAFAVTNGQDSRTILDTVGAEKLLGNGDMLFKPNGGTVKRLHGAYVSEDEVAAIVDFWKKQQVPDYKVDFASLGGDDQQDDESAGRRNSDIVDDPVYSEAIEYVLSSGKVSISALQRRFRVGYNRAARFVEQMEIDGIVTEADGMKQRMVRDRRNDL